MLGMCDTVERHGTPSGAGHPSIFPIGGNRFESCGRHQIGAIGWLPSNTIRGPPFRGVYLNPCISCPTPPDCLVMTMISFKTILSRSNRLCRLPPDRIRVGEGELLARQFDVAAMSLGFKLDAPCLLYFGSLAPVSTQEYAEKTFEVLSEMVGAHRKHNTYFRNFPKNVPSTFDFWWDTIGGHYKGARGIYGVAQHSYEDMVATHAKLLEVPSTLKVLTLGGTLEEEAERLYRQLAGSTVPLSGDDLALLGELAGFCPTVIPAAIPVRENLAVINAVRVRQGLGATVETTTDVLRLMVALSGGDVTLEKPTKFKSPSKAIRRAVMAALDEIVSDVKLGDAFRHQEEWKRVGEKVHPHEFKKYPNAIRFFEVARGDSGVKSHGSRVESAFAKSDLVSAVSLLAQTPGILFRSLDRLLSAGVSTKVLLVALQSCIGKVSGRVLLSVREHLDNRVDPGSMRTFLNRKGKAWVQVDTRSPLQEEPVLAIMEMIDEEIYRRLPVMTNLVVDHNILGVALPLSEKSKPKGCGVLPRGSEIPVTEGKTLRFFCYWKEAEDRTDYDLSVLLLDGAMNLVDHCSFRGLTARGMVHSGDFTSAPDGASEFIDVDLTQLGRNVQFIVPQVNIFAGEDFEKVGEVFFGFMERGDSKKGLPFEPSTVRVKSEIRGKGKIALPLMFRRGVSNAWEAKWMHLYLTGMANFNQVHTNKVTTGLIVRGINDRKSLTVGYLADLLGRKAVVDDTKPPTYIGFNTPDSIRGEFGYQEFTPLNLSSLIPE